MLNSSFFQAKTHQCSHPSGWLIVWCLTHGLLISEFVVHIKKRCLHIRCHFNQLRVFTFSAPSLLKLFKTIKSLENSLLQKVQDIRKVATFNLLLQRVDYYTQHAAFVDISSSCCSSRYQNSTKSLSTILNRNNKELFDAKKNRYSGQK